MVRVFTLPVGKTVKVGFEAQSQTGEGGYRYYSEFLKIEDKNRVFEDKPDMSSAFRTDMELL